MYLLLKSSDFVTEHLKEYVFCAGLQAHVHTHVFGRRLALTPRVKPRLVLTRWCDLRSVAKSFNSCPREAPTVTTLRPWMFFRAFVESSTVYGNGDFEVEF